jgi:hypothetical protein
MRSLLLAAAIGLGLASGPAGAVNLTATLDGAQAGVASPGTGSATITYDPGSNLLEWTITFSGLLAGATVAHFHGPAAPGVNAGIQVGIPLGAAVGMTSGTVMGMATITEVQEGQLLADLWYVNIHTSMFPAGEIRGQVVPEPGTLALAALGLAALGLARRALRG